MTKNRNGDFPQKEIKNVESTIKSKPDDKRLILGFKPNVFFMGMVSFLNDTASELIYPFLTIFLRSVLGAGYAFIGIIEGIAEGTASLMKLASGWFSDKVHKNKVFVFIGYLISVVMRPLIGFAAMWWHVLIIRFADRIGKGVRTAPRDALIANSVSESERGKSFGFHRAMDHLGAVVGALLGYVLILIFVLRTDVIHDERLKWVFLFAILPGIISLYLIARKVKDVPVQDDDTPGKGKVKPEKLTLTGFDRRFKIFLIILAIFTLGNSTDIFLLARVADIQGIGYKVALVWAVFHVVKSLLSTPAGIISDKIGRKAVIITGWIIYSGVYFGFAFAINTHGLVAGWILFLIYGVYYALTEGVAKAFIADLAPANMRGTAFGWFHFIEGIMLIPASIIFGLMWDNFQDWVPFCFGASLALLATLLFASLIPGCPVVEKKDVPEKDSVSDDNGEEETSGDYV